MKCSPLHLWKSLLISCQHLHLQKRQNWQYFQQKQCFLLPILLYQLQNSSLFQYLLSKEQVWPLNSVLHFPNWWLHDLQFQLQCWIVELSLYQRLRSKFWTVLLKSQVRRHYHQDGITFSLISGFSKTFEFAIVRFICKGFIVSIKVVTNH